MAGKAGGRVVEGHIQHGTLIEVCSMLCLDMVRFEHEVSTGQFRDRVILHKRLLYFHLATEDPAQVIETCQQYPLLMTFS